MFTNKRSPETAEKSKAAKSANPFVRAATHGTDPANVTVSGNGAKKYSTTGNPFVDQFGRIGSYKKPRTFAEISADCETLWGENPLDAVKFSLFLRTITRKTNLVGGGVTEEAQKGGEVRHESIFRMIWLANQNKDVFENNLPLFVSLGSWKDLFVMLREDLSYHGWNNRVLPWDYIGRLILSGLEDEKQVNLIKKYLPRIQAKSACKTIDAQSNTQVGKWLCSLLFGNKESGSSYKQYRKLKSSGTAHEWQQLISRRQFDRIDFSKIHGRALSLLVRSKFLKNHGLTDKYAEWVKKPETKIKYTGFVHELFHGLRPGTPAHEKETIDKQFATLVDKGRNNNVQTRFIVVRDTSDSMGSQAAGCNMSSYDVAKAMALYFSEFLTGAFADSWIEFNSDARMHTWQGAKPTEKWLNDKSSYVGSTNFQSVVDLFIKLKQQGIKEEDFPTGILCISDGEFNPSSLSETNVEASRRKLKAAGFSQDYCDNFTIVLWNIPNNHYSQGRHANFETSSLARNTFYYSGYNGATIEFLTSKILNAEELFAAAMNQEVLNMVQV